MSQIMKPLSEARISLLIYQYSPIEPAITDAVLRQFIISYRSFTGRNLAVAATTQSPFASYFDEVDTALLVSEEETHTKREFVVMLEKALVSLKQPEQAALLSLAIGIDLIRAMAIASERTDSDIQINYKSSEERRSVFLSKLDARTLNSTSTLA